MAYGVQLEQPEEPKNVISEKLPTLAVREE